MSGIRVTRDAAGLYTLEFPSEGVERLVFAGSSPAEIDSSSPAAHGSSKTINLGPYGGRMYFRVCEAGEHPVVVSDSHIPLSSVQNLRDLGGMKGFGGRCVTPGRIYRSGNPGRAAARDLVFLKSLRLETVIDFRSEAEKNPDESEFRRQFDWQPLAVNAGNLSGEEVNRMLQAARPDEIERRMLDIYREFPVECQPQFRRVLELAEQDRTFLYHCAAGKDRTGFATLLLLSALGVERQAIVDDYLLSNTYNAAGNERLYAMFAGRGIERRTLQPLLETRLDYIQAALEVIDFRYGGMDLYLRKILEVDVALIRKNYLQN